MPTRLEQALELLGYTHAKELHHKSNLIHAIALFAGLAHDAELEAECEQEIQRLRAEVEAKAKQEPVEVTVNIGDDQRNAGRGHRGIQINIGRNQRNCGGDFHE